MKLYECGEISKETMMEISYYMMTTSDHIFLGKSGITLIEDGETSWNTWNDPAYWDEPTAYIGKGHGKNWLELQPIEVLCQGKLRKQKVEDGWNLQFLDYEGETL